MGFRNLLLLGLTLLFSGAPAAARADATAALNQYAVAMASVHSYHADIQTGTQTVEMDVVLPDRMHIFGANGGPEAIIIRPDLWYKLGGGWTKVPMRGGSSSPYGPHLEQSRPPSDVARDYTVTDLGIKDTYHAYQLARKAGGDVVTLYLRPDSLPAKMEMLRDGATTTVLYSKFNNVTVEPPK